MFLAEASPYTTFFISPQWIETWLKIFGPLLDPEILTLLDSRRQPAGACIVVKRTVRRGPFVIRRVFLNTSGENEGEGPVVEFNNLLCLKGTEKAFCQSLRSYIERESWDEVWANGFCDGPPLTALREAFSTSNQQQLTLSDYYVDLDRLRLEGRTYESALGQKNRARLRQNFRDYGETRVSIAGTQQSAMTFLADLIELHTKSWNDRDQPGAFASPTFCDFHRALIRSSFQEGNIQLAHISCKLGTIGMLYNMIYGGDIYFYQSGFSYNSNKRLRPGFVTLAATIQYCLAQEGLHTFHFMAGGDHYKSMMGTGHQPLYWLIFRKRSLKNYAIDLSRHVRNFIRSTKSTEAAGVQAESI